MSKITVIADDNVVGIDGEFETVAFTGNPNIHAIQWDDVALTGEIEFKNQANEIITDFAPYQHFVGDHGASKAARIQVEIAAGEAAEAALTQQERRDAEYPSIEAQLAALHYARNGDPVPLTAIDTAMDVIDAKFPL